MILILLLYQKINVTICYSNVELLRCNYVLIFYIIKPLLIKVSISFTHNVLDTHQFLYHKKN